MSGEWQESKQRKNLFQREMGKTNLTVFEVHFRCWSWEVCALRARASGHENSKEAAMHRAFDVADLIGEQVTANKCWGCNDMPYCNPSGDEYLYQKHCRVEREWLKE